MNSIIMAKKSSTEKIKNLIYEILSHHVQDLIFITKVEKGSQFRYLFINDGGLQMEHMTDDYYNRNVKDVHELKRGKAIERRYATLIKEDRTQRYLEEITFIDGQKMSGECTITPVKDEAGEVQYIIETIRDVTDLFDKKAQDNKSNEAYQSIFDHNMDGILHIERHGRIIDSNATIQKITGYTKKQINHRSFYDLVPDQDVEVYENLVKRTIEGESLENFDCRFVHRDGRTILLQIKTIPIVIDLKVIGVYFVLRDISEQAKHSEMVSFLAFHDQLTGLLNRRALLKDLGSYIARANEIGTEIAVLSIDIDRFKHLNDSLGHLIGDKFLKMIAERFVGLQPIHGFVYRPGGDEFVILLENTSRSEVAQYAELLLRKFSQAFYVQSNEYYISLSIGISMFPEDGGSNEKLLKNAYEALYQVKEQGRAHYQFYRYEMNAGNTNIVEMATYLHKAIEREELMLYLQPQIHLKTKQIRSFEVLLRWYNPVLGYVSPADFIPLAEDSGLIMPIGKWVIDETCKYIKRWNDRGLDDFRLAINISPWQIQPSLICTLKDAIEQYDVDTKNLEIEITEGVMREVKQTIPILEEVKKLGITISVDDFGTGYCSMNYLKQFPIDILKIDRSFIKDVVTNPKDAAITTTIIHLGRSLGMEVIAEGVEDAQQAEFLRENKCDKGQGFYFAKPLPATEIEKMICDNL